MTSTTATTTAPTPLPQPYHYIRFAIAAPQSPDGGTGTNIDALQIRRALQAALAQSFGAALSHAYLDVLWVAPSGAECVVRASSQSDAASVMAAVAVANGGNNMMNSLRLSALKESPFLPSVSGESRKII